ncbi:hypothetical protein LCGC14_0684590 [marine sediment metagenome]|uniref:LamG domain-containing protein n=1 Tax=marine sediment metagenome TaxID=412755 RepID=A0A0F9T8M3_9ZZZZ
MSRLFDDGATDRLYIDQAVAGRPIAIVCRFNINDTSIFHALMGLGDKDTNDYFISMRAYPVGFAQKVSATEWNNPTTGVAVTSSGYTVNIWHHACAIFVSATDRRAFIDGANKGTNATNVSAINLDRTNIGVESKSTPANPVSGIIAEAAVYDLSQWPGATDALKADGFEKILPSLADGFTPPHFPLGLIAYWPLIRGLNDKVGGYNLTAVGTAVSNHPRVILPHGVQ